MTMQEVLEICRESSGNESMDFLDPISALGDSLDFLFVIKQIEEKSGKQISPKTLMSFDTVGRMAEWAAKS